MAYVYRDPSSGEVYFYDDNGQRWVIAQTKKDTGDAAPPPSGGAAVGLSITERVRYNELTPIPGTNITFGKRLEASIPARTLVNAARIRIVTAWIGTTYSVSGSKAHGDFVVGPGGYFITTLATAAQVPAGRAFKKLTIDITTPWEPVHANTPAEQNGFVGHAYIPTNQYYGDDFITPDAVGTYDVIIAETDVTTVYDVSGAEGGGVQQADPAVDAVIKAGASHDADATFDPTAGGFDYTLETWSQPQVFAVQAGNSDGSLMSAQLVAPSSGGFGIALNDEAGSSPYFTTEEKSLWFTVVGSDLDTDLIQGEAELTVWYSPLP